MPLQTNSACEASGSPVINLVTDSDLHRHTLKNILLDAGYNAIQVFTSRQLRQDTVLNQRVDVWLIDTSSIPAEVVERVVEGSDAPLLANDDIPTASHHSHFRRWQKRLLNKLQLMVLPEETEEPALKTTANGFEKVWVLAASLGGPEAVQRFLERLAPDLPIAMVYAQHIESPSNTKLPKILKRNTPYVIERVTGKQLLAAGKVTVIPVEQQVQFLDHGEVVVTDGVWQGSFQPAVDQVIAELARIYRDRLGVIIFSGLCDDGVAGCRVAKACGATLWAQSPESCIGVDMPQAAINTGFVSKQGSPEQLADALTGLTSDSGTGNHHG